MATRSGKSDPAQGDGARPARPGVRYERICLLTPYSGTNFGDGAIQQATIDAILKRLPHAGLTGITLAPDDATARHGIPAVAITGLATRFYSESLFETPGRPCAARHPCRPPDGRG
jgi:hypothetical protein